MPKAGTPISGQRDGQWSAKPGALISRQLLILIAAGAIVGLAPPALIQATGPGQLASAIQQPSSSASYRAVLDKYCVTCHNQRLRTAGLALEGLELSNLSAR